MKNLRRECALLLSKPRRKGNFMRLQLLGTAAAEGWPAPFCVCPACEEARRRGGPNLRTRSGALLDEDFKIDLCADTLVQMQLHRRHLAGIKTLVFTHQHSDHIAPDELTWALKPFTNTPPGAIDVYANAEALQILRGHFSDPAKAGLQLHQLNALEEVTTAQGDRLLPLPADHVAGAFVLRIRRGDKTIFYGHDSGLYPTETLDALSDGVPLDIALFDCTNGGAPSSNRGHMGISGVVQMADELRSRGAITPSTRLIATHFSHNGGLGHEELVRAFLPHGIEVAFDGMMIEV
jgi:phosphoribosyl 1,2-cyclic phosphate phosphodiesterase